MHFKRQYPKKRDRSGWASHGKDQMLKALKTETTLEDIMPYFRAGRNKSCKFYKGPHQYEITKKTQLRWYSDERWMIEYECKCKKKNIKFTN